MTYESFQQLQKFKQVDFTLQHGIEVGRRLEYDDFLKLYAVFDFYVELRFAEDLGEVYAIYHSRDMDQLAEPYLKLIDLEELLQ